MSWGSGRMVTYVDSLGSNKILHYKGATGAFIGTFASMTGAPKGVLFARLSCFARRPFTVFFSAAGAWVAAKFLPVFLRHIDTVMFGRLLDIGEGELAVLVRDADSLIETRNGVPNVARVGQRLFALLWKGENAVGKIAPLSEFPMLLVWFPGCTHSCVSICFNARSRFQTFP